MRAHAAFWAFVVEHGTPQAKEHARQWEPTKDESRWLFSRQGLHLRTLWLALPPDEREQLMASTPDGTYRGPPSGISDDRGKMSFKSPAAPTPTGKDPPAGAPSISAAEKTTPSPAKTAVAPLIKKAVASLPSVSRLKKYRVTYLRKQQAKAMATAHVGAKTENKTQLAIGLAAFWRTVGAEVLLAIPEHLREMVGQVFNDRVKTMKSFSSSGNLESLKGLQNFDGAARVARAIYTDAAREAMEECARHNQPNPDPELSFGLLPQPRGHPDYDAIMQLWSHIVDATL